MTVPTILLEGIIQYPDVRLLQVSKSIVEINSRIKELITLMRYHLSRHAIGLAAPQLGELVRLIGVRRSLGKGVGDDLIFIVNPVVVRTSDKKVSIIERCLSINYGRSAFTVSRWKWLKVKGQDLNGKTVSYKAHDLFGYQLQHEIDHLDGILISK